VVLLRRRSEGGTNNLVTEDASVTKERVARGGQMLQKRRSKECVKLSLAPPGNMCGESVESRRYRSPRWGKFYGNDRSCTRTNCNWYKNSSLMIHPSGWRFVRTCWAGWKRIRVCPNGSFLVIKRPFLSGKVNRHNIRIWGSQNPHALIEMERESQSERVLCHFQKTRVRSILLRGDSYWKGVPGHDGKLVNATTRGWGGTRVHLPTRRGPTTLA